MRCVQLRCVALRGDEWSWSATRSNDLSSHIGVGEVREAYKNEINTGERGEGKGRGERGEGIGERIRKCKR